MATTELSPRALGFCVVLLAASLAGCSRSSRDDASGDATSITVQRRSASAPPDALGPGDVRIVSADSGVDLALLGDSISAGLSAKSLEKVRRETDTTTVTGSGFGASIEKIVKSTVASAIGTRVSFPLSAVKDVRYEDGELKFDWTAKPIHMFTASTSHGKPIMQSFRPEDAQRFVAAVRARKGRR